MRIASIHRVTIESVCIHVLRNNPKCPVSTCAISPYGQKRDRDEKMEEKGRGRMIRAKRFPIKHTIAPAAADTCVYTDESHLHEN